MILVVGLPSAVCLLEFLWKREVQQSLCGCGSKLNHHETAGFGPCFHLLGLFLTHSHVRFIVKLSMAHVLGRSGSKNQQDNFTRIISHSWVAPLGCPACSNQSFSLQIRAGKAFESFSMGIHCHFAPHQPTKPILPVVLMGFSSKNAGSNAKFSSRLLATQAHVTCL